MIPPMSEEESVPEYLQQPLSGVERYFVKTAMQLLEQGIHFTDEWLAEQLKLDLQTYQHLIHRLMQAGVLRDLGGGAWQLHPELKTCLQS